MSKLVVVETVKLAPKLKSFRGPWMKKGQLLLACAKCQRKLKDDGDAEGLAKLKKTLKKRGKITAAKVKLTVIETKCLKVCPRKGVAVCTQVQVGAGGGTVLRTKADVDLLLAECAADEARYRLEREAMS